MTEIGATHIISAFDAIAGVMETNRDALCALDGEIGDADHGIGMALGFGAIRTALATLEAAATPTDVFNTAAKSFLNAVGASTGPLYATAFMRAAAAVKGKNVLETEDISVVLTAMADGIAHLLTDVSLRFGLYAHEQLLFKRIGDLRGQRFDQ